MTNPTTSIPIEWLNECFRLDEHSGFVHWKDRPESHFRSAESCGQFNARHSGKRADLSKYPSNGYRRIRVNYRGRWITLTAHRVVFALKHGCWPLNEVDHIDRDRDNNRPANLRDVDHSTNLRNSAFFDGGAASNAARKKARRAA